MTEKTYQLALAGLLYDIEGFASLAGSDMNAPAFVDRYVPTQWSATIHGLIDNGSGAERNEQTLITVAGRLARGTSVAKPTPADGAAPNQVLSIFCQVTADNQDAAKEFYLPVKEMRLDRESLFPTPPMDSKQLAEQYATLWHDFCAQAERLGRVHDQNGSLTVYVESMLFLLQRYAWCVPAPTNHGVSLFDHGRITAALASVLSGTHGISTDEPTVADDELALLVGGDISGVQDFIYTISSRGATPALRGRSFYLQLLTDIVARYILQELDLPFTNLLYAGGGNYYLLARTTDRSKLKAIQGRLSRLLLHHHNGDLYVAMADSPLSGQDLMTGNIGAAWQNLHRNLQRIKRQRFAELGADLAHLFEPIESAGLETNLCQVCGQEHFGTTNDETVRKCPPCQSYEELGDHLRHAVYLAIHTRPATADDAQPEKATPGIWSQVLSDLGFDVQVVQHIDDIAVPSTALHSTILALQDDAQEQLIPSQRVAVGRRLLVNTTPILTADERTTLLTRNQFTLDDLPPAGRVKPFGVLEYDSIGVKRLGVLRMDVDNLGALFQRGLGNGSTLPKVAALSFNISLFFEGWVGTLAAQQNQQDGTDRLYSIYSGGDDLFFVGAWDAVLDLAVSIQQDLTDYAAHHPGIHASAGVTLVGGKYPLSQAAQDAGEAEHQAKAAGKNAIAFLGQAVPWQSTAREVGFDRVQARVEEITGWVDSDRLNRSFIMALHSIDEEWKAWRQQESSTSARFLHKNQALYLGPWLWHLIYSLTRTVERNGDSDLRRDIDQLIDSIITEEIVVIGMIARTAELWTRQ